MFDRSSRYYDDIYSFLDYESAAKKLIGVIDKYHGDAQTLLDVACGTGKHIEYLRRRFLVEGLDINRTLLDLMVERCPGTPAHLGNMTNFDLQRKFDVVTCLFCSIGHTVTSDSAEKAIASMAMHLRPGGLLIVEPWITPEMCWTSKLTTDVVDRPNLKIIRMHTHEKHDATSVYDIHYLIGTPTKVEHFVERETLGLYSRDQYMSFFTAADLPVDYLDIELFPGHKYGLYVAKASGEGTI